MPAAHSTTLYDVADCKLYPLLSDSGASPSYGAAIDVPGIYAASIDPQVVVASLKGDGGRVIAHKGKVDRVTMSLTYGRLDLDVLAAILGSTVTDPSSSQARLRHTAGTQLPRFAVGLTIEDTDSGVGCVQIIAYSSQVTATSIAGLQSESYAQPSFDVECIGLNVTGPHADWMLDINVFTTLTALPASPI